MATADEAERAYTYKPLEEPDKSIRLLKILSVTPQIKCAFKVAHLKDSPVFSCLSYVWGDATITEPATVEGNTLHITVNLTGAIRDVHRQWSAGQLLAPGEEQWLWADALCIDQKHAQEKNHQVPLMEQIYSSAHRVFAWLGGEDDGRASKAVDAYHIILHAIHQLPGYGFIRDRAQNGLHRWSKEDVLAEVGIEFLDAITDLTWLRKHYNTEPVPAESVSTLNDAIELFNLPYWTRLWIVQEVVLARDVILLCGSKNISWLEVCGVQVWIKLFQMKYSSADKPQYMPIQEWFVLTEYGVSNEYIRICTLKSCAGLRKTIQRRQGVSLADSSHEAILKAQFRQARFQFDMSECTLHYQATDAKDYVYALGGLTGLRIPTDYSSQTTLAQVYQEDTMRWLNALAWGGDFEGDPYHRIVCDLWFLTYAGIGFLWKPIQGLPSWVPNLKGVAECICNSKDEHSTPPFIGFFGDSNDSGIFQLQHGTQSAAFLDSSLCCQAVVVEDSINIGPTVHSYKSFDTHSVEEDEWLLWIYDLMTTEDILIPIVVALYSLEKGLKSLDEKDAARLLLADLEYVCRKRRAISRVSFHTALGVPMWLSLFPEMIADDRHDMTTRRAINLKRLHIDLGNDCEHSSLPAGTTELTQISSGLDLLGPVWNFSPFDERRRYSLCAQRIRPPSRTPQTRPRLPARWSVQYT
jgi:hypothetical protein